MGEMLSTITTGYSRVMMAVEDLRSRYRELVEEMIHLKTQGMKEANPHWRQGKYLYLIHPTGPDGVRIREYIGSDPGKVAKALEEVERQRQYEKLQEELNQLRQKMGYVETAFRIFCEALDIRF